MSSDNKIDNIDPKWAINRSTPVLIMALISKINEVIDKFNSFDFPAKKVTRGKTKDTMAGTNTKA